MRKRRREAPCLFLRVFSYIILLCLNGQKVASLAVFIFFGVGTDAHTLAANGARVDRVKRSAVERNSTILPPKSRQQIRERQQQQQREKTDKLIQGGHSILR